MNSRKRKNCMDGMLAKVLRRHGFFREKNKHIFVRHTIGLGGIYIEILNKTAKLTLRDHQFTATYTSASILEKVIGQLNVVEALEKARWEWRISEFIKDDREHANKMSPSP